MTDAPGGAPSPSGAGEAGGAGGAGRPAGGPAIAVRDLWRGFGRDRVLRGVSFDALGGQGLAVLGPNGSGKSTLLRALAGLLRPARGSVRVLGDDPCAAPWTRRRLGYVGHEPMLYGGLTVHENLRLWATLYGLAGARTRADEACALLDLGRHRDVVVGRLSRGLVQRTAVARALLHAPAVLLLDEAFAGLDLETAAGLLAHLGEFRRAGGTIVLATHQPREALQLAVEARVLTGGRLSAPLRLHGQDTATVEAWYRDTAAARPHQADGLGRPP